MGDRFKETAHFHGNGLFGYEYTSIERLRLSFKDTCYRKTRSTERVWRVDGVPVDFDAIDAALSVEPIFSDEECAALDRLTDWTGRDVQREIGWDVLRGLTAKASVEWDAGKVRRRSETAPNVPAGTGGGE